MVETLLKILFGLLMWVLLFPVVWIMSTPVILVSAIFSKKPYWKSVKDKYRAVTEWWAMYGSMWWE